MPSILDPLLSSLPVSQKYRIPLFVGFVIAGYGASWIGKTIWFYRRLSQIKQWDPNLTIQRECKKRSIHLNVLDLDGTLLLQSELLNTFERTTIYMMQEWGPQLRMGCAYGTYYRFENFLNATLPDPNPQREINQAASTLEVSMVGSNDFHHVSLLLLRRIRYRFNVVIFDNHPDWFQFAPMMHCGCWLNHVAKLPTVGTIFHMGGRSGEFNETGFVTPWAELISGKIKVFPAYSKWTQGRWSKVPQTPLAFFSNMPGKMITKERIRSYLEPYRRQLQELPLVITLDKDVMRRDDAVQNWNSGFLSKEEIGVILEVLAEFAVITVVDILGEWSPVKTRGLFRKWLNHHQHEQEYNNEDPKRATEINQKTNLYLLQTLAGAINQ
eukprot:TRINITY_DN2860_c0_g1_i1.p1 TRINITY_DN2860_c0_g1~~TRINITY_DN2860_c0_g1_i1.p1  ORF type:complete len:383 (+),score=84.26 TRINITY_DN2860_c0_g1_i1:3-1151(+)